MARIIGGTVPLAVLLGWLSTAALGAAESEDVTLKKLQELNRVTGTEPLQGALKILQEDKKGAKNLVAAALPMAKAKKASLSYNAALVLALVAADTKDMAASEAFFRICMDKAAKLQSTDRIFQAYRGLIVLYYKNKKYDDCARICRELLELKTDDGKPRIVMTAIMTPLGDIGFNEEDTFDPAKEIRPDVHRLLIQAVAKQGKTDQALKLIDNLLKAQDTWEEYELKGWVLREAGKFAEAAKTYQDVISRVAKDKDLEPEKKEVYLEAFRYTLSNVYVDMGKIDQASEQLEQLLAKKPDEPGYNNDLGYIWADNGRKLDEAEQMIRKALELDRKRRQANPKLDPEDDHDKGAYLDSLGWVLFKKKNYQEAKKYLLEAVQDKSSMHIEIFDHLGDVHMALGEKAEALAAWRKGLEYIGEERRDLERRAIVEKKIADNK